VGGRSGRRPHPTARAAQSYRPAKRRESGFGACRPDTYNSPIMQTTPRLVVGTAGHIDHGKSRLVLALTGTDPDRLPEEKARGMTIDLGFAHARIEDCDVWFVDVPGHERFIRNMVAGASGVDVAMLVVAADDSVMPQTREHAEVLRLLGFDRCLVVLTKMDLVDDEWAEAVEEEVGELLAELGIQPLAMLRTSAQTGRGIDELRARLAELARARESTGGGPYSWFRLPIDRAFNVPGRGTVVTGSVAHGAVQADDELELWPAGRRVRVRDLQTHHEGLSAAAGRMRLALNLAGVPLDEVRRGHELATPGYLEPTRIMDVWVTSLRMPGKQVRRNIRLRLHIATNEVLAELRLVEQPAALQVRDLPGQLLLAEPVVATWGQRFILRDESGSRTLGGGAVLRPAAHRWSAKRPAHRAGLEALRTGDPARRLEEVIRAQLWNPTSDALLASRAGLSSAGQAAELCRLLGSRGRIVRLQVASSEVYVHPEHLEALAQRLGQRLRDYLAANPRLPGVPRHEWPGWMPRTCPERLRPALAEWLIARGKVALADGYVLPPGHRAAMSPEDQQLYEAICEQYRRAAYQPPSLEQLASLAPRNPRRVRDLVELALARGRLVRINADWLLHVEHWQALEKLVVEAIEQRGGLTVSELRTMLDSTRKYVVPIAEALDAAGITRRQGDLRVLGKKARRHPADGDAGQPRTANSD